MNKLARQISILCSGCRKLFAFVVFACLHTFSMSAQQNDSINFHSVILDDQSKLLPWTMPGKTAYDNFLRLRWDFIKTKVPLSPGPGPRSIYPQYYFYCAYKNDMQPDTWMNDVGEKIPNWFESARLYYAYTGDTVVLRLAESLVDYSLSHGISNSDFAWPGFPYTTTNAGDTLFRGFTSAKLFALHEIQVDHAGEMGDTYYRMYQLTGNTKYLKAALRIANTLAAKVRSGSAIRSPWPYRVIMKTGKVTAEYGANWTGCYRLLNDLVKASLGNTKAYKGALDKVRRFLLLYPMKTGYWTDGHSDTDVRSHTYKSNLSASNFCLFLLDYPEFDTRWQADVPKLIKWTEDYFVNRTAKGEPASQWGASLVGEQDTFLYKMDYQTARYAATCARWYAFSGDTAYKEKAYRSVNWVTYCNDSTGKAAESPLSRGINSWWSDSYGEGPRMIYPIMAAVPAWAPPGENHILYSNGILTSVVYGDQKISYVAKDATGIEYLRSNFFPNHITIAGHPVKTLRTGNKGGFEIASLGNGDFFIKIYRIQKGTVVLTAS